MAKAVADVNKEIQGGFASNDADSERTPKKPSVIY